ncbi:enoyl-CoA hydratase/isomerase family protein [Szabonella alba]|uniref:Enoyl-CoA hydratase/isomerase family protein n=1 Tax=Szabonella alba TaxID=2804194 RepID=A0A8K0V8K8_9RHOB|nr:enoyl-CoA hydratase/isomerase family protein [Szabonella alba]MBL4917126.1 enoyl-CoA hydratase/isomerase family protein [Szabonella alba]
MTHSDATAQDGQGAAPGQAATTPIADPAPQSGPQRGQADAPARLEVLGDVAVLILDNPPINALGHGLRQAMQVLLEEAEADPAVRAILLLAEGRSFPAGADISEFGKPPRAPLLPDLCRRIADCPKPVIAAMHGSALGGGLELALAAHHRIALASARLGLPEVTLGLLPGAGGTQRLPRLVGVEPALRLMLSGKPVTASEALAMGLVDRICEDDLPGAAYGFALDLLAGDVRKSAPGGIADIAGGFAAISRARASVKDRPVAAAARIVDCVEAAMLLPFEQGLEFERAAFLDLVATPEAAALRHVFFAERRAAGAFRTARGKAAGAGAARIGHIALLGVERPALRLTLMALQAGLRVTIADPDAAALSELLEGVALSLEEDKAAGRLDVGAAADRWARIQPELPEALPGGIDIVFPDGVFAQPGAVLPDLPAGATCVGWGRSGLQRPDGTRPPAVILHPPGPGPARLAEIVTAEGQDDSVAAALADWFRGQGLAVIRATDQGVLGAMGQALHRAIDLLRQAEGQETLTTQLRGWGFLPHDDGRLAPRGGFAPFCAGHGAPLLGAMANAGLHLLGEGAALRPGDLDMAAISGLGLPRWSGGPMFWAGQRGLLVLREDLRRWAEHDAALWTPAPLLERMLREGVTLAQLDAL